MPDLIPFAVIHKRRIGGDAHLDAPAVAPGGLSSVLGYVLPCHRRKPGGKPGGSPLFPQGSTPTLLTGLSPNCSFLFMLMISEALSLEGNLSKQGARTLPAGSGVVALLVGVYLSSPY
jgi:hypothetical protein